MKDKARIVMARKHLQEHPHPATAQKFWAERFTKLFDDFIVKPNADTLARGIMMDLLCRNAKELGRSYHSSFLQIPPQSITPVIRALALLFPSSDQILTAFIEEGNTVSYPPYEQIPAHRLSIITALLEVDDWSTTYPGAINEKEQRSYSESLYTALVWVVNGRFLKGSPVSDVVGPLFSSAFAKYLAKAQDSHLRHQEVIALSDVLRIKMEKGGFFAPGVMTAEEVFAREFFFKVSGKGYSTEHAIGMLAADLEINPLHLIGPAKKP